MGVARTGPFAGLCAVLLIAACGNGFEYEVTGGSSPVTPITIGQVTLNDVIIDVRANNETSIAEVSFQLNDVTKTIAGDAIDTGVQFTFESIDSGGYTLKTNLGNFFFTLNDDGSLSASSSVPIQISGTTIIIQNDEGFATLTVDALGETSVNEMAYKLEVDSNASLPADDQIGEVQTIDGADAADGVTFAFEGMVKNQRFRLRTLWGSALFFIDGSGDLQPFNPATDGKVIATSGATITWQNDVSFDPLKLPAVADTTLKEVSYFLQTGENTFSFPTQDRQVGETKTVAGTDAKAGVTFPMLGMSRFQEFLLRTTWGDVFFEIDADGKLVPRADDTSADRFEFDTDTMTLQNVIDHTLKVRLEFDDPTVESATFKLRSQQGNVLPADRTVDEDMTIAGTELATGVEFDVRGMFILQRLRVFTEGIPTNAPLEAGYQPRADGGADFSSNVTVLSATQAEIAFTPPATSPNSENTFLVELCPIENTPPVVDAGPNVKILAEDQAGTTLVGTATDADGDDLTCRWLLGATVVSGPKAVAGSECPLDLGDVDPLAGGPHVFVLEVTDGTATVQDSVVVTIDNSPPIVTASGAGVYQRDAHIDLRGTVSDFDGDTLTIVWRSGGRNLFPLDVRDSYAGGEPRDVRHRVLPATELGLGVHVVELAVDDGVNEEVVEAMTVEIVDVPKPILCPTCYPRLLWPANDELRCLDFNVGAWSTSYRGLEAEIEIFLEGGAAVPEGDAELVSYKRCTQEAKLKLRATRTEGGEPRVYVIRVTAEDGGLVSSTEIRVKVAQFFTTGDS